MGQILDRLREREQIMQETDISASYFNCVLNITDPDVIQEPRRYFKGGEEELRREVRERIAKFPTYTEYLQERIERLNEDAGQYEQPRVTIRDFFTDKNQSIIAQIDALAQKIYSLDPIDFLKLKQLMYEISVLIYGEKYREKLSKRFYIS